MHKFVFLAAGLALSACAQTLPPAPVAAVPAPAAGPVAPPPAPARDIAPVDRDCLIAAMFYEAGGEGADGLAAVGHVVLNRLDDRPPGTTICDVIYEPRQFGWTRKVRRDAISATIGTSQRWQNAAIMAEAVLSDRVKDPTQSAHSFYSVLQYRKKPRWAKNLQVTVKIGNHVFMR